MDEINNRIIANMINIMNEYESGTKKLSTLVKELEGSITAFDPSLKPEKERDFFNLLTTLEEANAMDEEERYKPFIRKTLGGMKLFLAALK